jgi:hypothetical protein
MTTMQDQVHSAAKTLLKEHMFQCWGRTYFRFDGREWQPVSKAELLPLAEEVLTRNGDFGNPKLQKLMAQTAAKLRQLIPWASLEWGRAYEDRNKAK